MGSPQRLSPPIRNPLSRKAGHGGTGGRWREQRTTPHPPSSTPTTTTTTTTTDSPQVAASCYDVYLTCGSSDGIFWVNPSGAAPYRAVCAGEGWTLAMKTNGGSGTFVYESGYWTNSDLLNSDPDVVASQGPQVEAKLQPFTDHQVTNIRIVFQMMDGRVGSPLVLSVGAVSSLRSLFTQGFTPTYSGRDAWIWSIPGGAANQPYCNSEGINVVDNRYNRKYRIGIWWNEQNDCGSDDTAMGVGGSSGVTYATGTWMNCCATYSNWYGSAPAMAAVFIRGPPPPPTPTSSRSASKTSTPTASTSSTATSSVTSTSTASSSSSGLPLLRGRVVELSSSVCSFDNPGGRLSVAEVTVMTGASYNLAPAAVVTASSFYASTPPDLAVDNRVDQAYPPSMAIGNFWSSSSPCSAASPQWLRLVLPQYVQTDATIASITIYNRGEDWCGDCQRTPLIGAQLRLLESDAPGAGVVWNGTIVDSALVHIFYIGLPGNSASAYVHNLTGAPVSSLRLMAPYPTPTQTVTQTPSQTATATATSTSTPTPTATATKTSWRVPTQTASFTRSGSGTPSSSSTLTPSATPSGSVTSSNTPTGTTTVSASPWGGGGGCPLGWTQPSGSEFCYRGFTELRDWSSANSQCGVVAQNAGRSGGFLASVRNIAEAQYVYDSRCGIGGDPWIGLNQPGGSRSRSCCWIWASGADPAWIRNTGYGWNNGEPNNYGGNEYCVMTGNDARCDSTNTFCCELSAKFPTSPSRSSTVTASITMTATLTSSPSWSTGASLSSSASATSTGSRAPSITGTSSQTASSSTTRTTTASSTITPSQTGTDVPTVLGPDAISGLSVWLNLADVQNRSVGNCVTNWAARGYAGISSYVVWGGCPYLGASTELGGYHPVQFDTGRSMKLDTQSMSNGNYLGREEYTLAYLARVTGSPSRVLQADNNYLAGWYGGCGDVFHFDEWLGSSCTTTWNLGWALFVVQSSRSTGITASRNGRVIVNSGRAYNGPNNIVFNWGGISSERSDFLLADVVLFDRKISDVERQQLEGSILWKYGLSSLLPAVHPFAASPPIIPSVSATQTDSASPTPYSTPSSSVSATLSMGATPSPSFTMSPGYNQLCPDASWVNPPGSMSCYRAAPASLVPGSQSNGGLTADEAQLACTALASTSAPARVRGLGEAQFAVRSFCGIAAPGSSVSDDGYGVWLGLAATAPASQRNRTAGWGWGSPYSTAATTSDASYMLGDGAALWRVNEPSNSGTGDTPCVHVTSDGALDDVPCWVTLMGACCEAPLATPSSSASSSSTASITTTPSATASSSAAVSVTPTQTASSSVSASSSLSASSTLTSSATATAVTTPSQTPSPSPFCKPEFFSLVRGFASDGSLLGFDAGAATMDACRLSCCIAPGCTGFTLGVRSSGAVVPDTCTLYANVTQLVPNAFAATGLLRTALPGEVVS